jgi:glycosyltransferase involved in cell wall biosynthesis
MPKVSIIITCYNLGIYLEEALKSALAQTFADCEVLLVDDGSTDQATIEVLNKLPSDPRLHILRIPNQGVAQARNHGIELASGQYILPLDADDRILPDYLGRAVRILDQRIEVGFVGCYYRTFGEREAEYTPKAYQLPDILVENTIPISSVFRRECWQQIGGYCPDLNGMEDWDLWLGILGLGYVGAIVPKILFEYRIRQNSNIAQIRDPEVYRQRLQLLYQRHKQLYADHIYGVLSCKDHLFARQLAYNYWLEQQWHIWEDIAHQRAMVIDAGRIEADSIHRVSVWQQLQNERWQRITAENPRASARFLALVRGAWRVLNRQLRKLVPRLMSKVGLIRKH